MSAPAQKLGPAPVTTRTRTAGSAGEPGEDAGQVRPHAARSWRCASRRGRWSGRRRVPSPGDRARCVGPCSSAEVVGGEGVALRRVAGLVPGHEPLLPLLGGAVGERVLVDAAAAQVLLDEVVADAGGGVQGPVDVVLGDLGDQRPRRTRRARSRRGSPMPRRSSRPAARAAPCRWWGRSRRASPAGSCRAGSARGGRTRARCT